MSEDNPFQPANAPAPSKSLPQSAAQKDVNSAAKTDEEVLRANDYVLSGEYSGDEYVANSSIHHGSRTFETPELDVAEGSEREIGSITGDEVAGTETAETSQTGSIDDAVTSGPVSNPHLGNGRGEPASNNEPLGSGHDRFAADLEQAPQEAPDASAPVEAAVTVAKQVSIESSSPGAPTGTPDTDPDGSPTDISVSGGAIDENAPGGAVVATLGVIDPEPGDSFTFEIVGGSPLFEIAGNQIVVRAGADIDFEDAATHAVTLRVTDSSGASYEEAVTIDINNLFDEAPTDITDGGAGVDENAAAGTTVATLSSIDADAGDSHSYAITSDPSGFFEIVGNEVRVAAGAALDFETDQTHDITVEVTDAGGNTYSEVITLTVNDLFDEDPTDITLTGGSVDENAAAGTTVATLSSVDADAGDSFAYAITGDASGFFEIVGNEVRVAAGAAIDFETDQYHDITVEVTDAGGNTYSEVITLTVNDLFDEDPTDITLTGGFVDENAMAGTTVATLSSVDADAGDSFSYVITNDASGFFEIVGNEVRLAAGATIDFEGDQSHDITVEVTDLGGNTYTETITVNVNDVQEFSISAISDSDVAADSVSEAAVNGTVVGVTAFASDADGTDTVSYSLSNDAGGAFTIDATTGVVTVSDTSLIDHETATSMTIEVTATSTDGSTSVQSYSIGVTDTDEFDVSAVSDTNVAADSVSETAANGSVVGVTAFASDADGTDTVSYSLSNDAGGAFTIDATTGVVTVADTSLIDCETATSMTIEVTATSTDGSTSVQSYSIGVTDTDEFDVSAVSDTNVAADSVSETAADGSVVGVTAFASDADGTDTVSYSLSNDAGGAFTIDATTGVVTVSDTSLIDYETATSMTIEVTATSTDGSTSVQSYSIGVTDTDEFDVSAISDTNVAADTVSETAANGSVVGVTAFASDADGTDTVSYSLSNDAGGAFTIDATTGVVTVADISLIDYETATSMTIEVTAMSTDGSTSVQSYSIGVTDTDEFDVSAISDTNVAADTVSEIAANGSVVGVTAFASDADGTDTVSYSLSNDAGGAFTIDATTGVVTVADTSLIDYETATSMTIEVTANSTDGSTSVQSYSIGVTDTDEFDVSAVSDTNVAADSVSESAANGSVVGVTAFASDADGTDTVSYSLSNDAGGAFTIDATTGVVTVSDTSLIDYETATSMTIEVTATSTDGSTSVQSYSIGVTDTDEFDVSAISDTNVAADSVSESAANGSVVGVTAFASDADGTDTVSYSLSNDAGGAFTINATTGVVTVADTSLIDHETATSMTIEVTATSTDGSTSVQSYSIGVTDTDEFDVSAISDTNVAADTVSETAANGSVVGVTAFASDADGTDTVSYSLSNDAGGAFTIDATTGVVTVSDTSLIDYEAATSMTIEVTATSTDGSTSVQSYSIGVTNVMDETPTDLTFTGGPVDENAAAATTVATLSTVDADAGDSFTYSITSDPSGFFEIAGNEVRVAAGATIDFETDQSHDITVQVTDAGGNTYSEVITLTVNDLFDEDPTDITLTGGTVDENAAAGTPVATLSSVDADAGDTFTYAITADASGFFEIVGNEVRVAAGAAIDFEADQSHDITVEVTDAGGNTYSEVITLTANDLFDENPTDITLTGGSVDENAAAGTTVATLSSVDADAGDSFTYSITNDASGFFEIVGNEVRVAAGAAIDFETDQLHQITIEVSDAGGNTYSEVIDVNVNNLFDEAPTDILVDSTSGLGPNLIVNGSFENPDVASNSLQNFSSISGWQTTVGVVQIHDNFGGHTASDGSQYLDTDGEAGADEIYQDVATQADTTYRLSFDAADRIGYNTNGFEVFWDGNLVATIEPATTDWTTFSFDVSGSGGLDRLEFRELGDDSDAFGSIIDNVQLQEVYAGDVDENASAGTVVATLSAVDADYGDSHTYAITNDPSGYFEIVGDEVRVAAGAAIDFEVNQTHDITVEVTDAGGNTYSEVVTVNVNDLDEFDVSAVSDTNVAVDSISESAANGSVVGVTAFAADADATDTVSYSLSNDAGGAFTIDVTTGVVTVADTSLIDYETAISMTIEVTATSTDGSTSVQSYSIGVTDTDEFDVGAISDSDVSANTAAEDASVGATVGVTALATDADGTDTVTYSLSDDAGGLFAIDANTGVVTVAGSLDLATEQFAEATDVGSVHAHFDATAVGGTLDADSNGYIEALEDLSGSASEHDATQATANSQPQLVAGAMNGQDALYFDGVDDYLQIANNSDMMGTTTSTTVMLSFGTSDDVTSRQVLYDQGRLVNGLNIYIDNGELYVGGYSEPTGWAGSYLNTTIATDAEYVVTLELDGTNNTFTAYLNGEVIGTDVSSDYLAGGGGNIYLGGMGDKSQFHDGDQAGDGHYFKGYIGEFAAYGEVLSDADRTSLENGMREQWVGDVQSGEVPTSHDITVVATSTDGSTSTETMTINVSDVDEFDVDAVSDSDGSANSISESAANGTSVGITGLAADADATDTVSYSLSNDAGGAFTIDATTGVVTVADTSLIDYETATSMTIEVTATSTDGSSSVQSYNIGVNDVNEAPTNIAMSGAEFDTVFSGLTHGWKLEGDAADSIGGNDGTLTGTTTVTGNEGDALRFDEAGDYVTIPDVTMNNEFTVSFQFKVDENSGSLFQYIYSHGDINGANSLNVFMTEASHGTDPSVMRTVIRDTNDTLDNSALQFDISGIVGDGEWHTYTLTVESGVGSTVFLDGVEQNSDPRGGDSFNPSGDAYLGARQDLDPNRMFGGDLDNVQIYDRPLVDSEVNELHFGPDQTVAVGTVVANIASVTDPDAGDTFTYALTDDAGGLFSIDVNTGDISVAQATSSTPGFTLQPGGSNPFDGIDIGSYATPTFADIDGDGDLDAFIGDSGGRLHYYENTGDASSPNYVPTQINPFGLTDIGDYSDPEFVDIDNDGDLDAFVGAEDGQIHYFQNTGNSTSPSFASAVTNPFGFSDIGSAATPTFVDIDNDGDLDAFIGDSDGDLNYYENTGTVSNPTFTASGTNPFGLSNIGDFANIDFADIDGDGDMDAFVGEDNGTVNYFENTGTASSAAFAPKVSDPFGISDEGDYAAPAFADIDGDGDLDAIIGNQYGTLSYFENTTSAGTETDLTQLGSQTIDVEVTDSGGLTYTETIGLEFGTNGDDTITGTANDEIMYGFGGSDTLDGGGGDDVLYASDPAGGGAADPVAGGAMIINDGGETDQYAEVSGFSGFPTGDITYEIRFTAAQPPSSQFVLVSYASSAEDNEFTIYKQADGDIRVYVNDSSHIFAAPSTNIVDGNEHTVSVSWDQSSGLLSLYVDGALESSTTHVPGATIGSGGTLILGQEQGSEGGGFDSSQIFNGTIDEVRLFNDVRTAQEVSDNYDQELSNPATEQGLVGNWQMSSESGGAVSDLAGSNDFNLINGSAVIDDGSAGDTLYGGDGNDTLVAGSGTNVLDGGTGTDTADYSGSTAGVTVDLSTGTGTGGDADGDTLTDIENVTGSDYADILTGDTADNTLSGGTGDDTLNGGDGNDLFLFHEGDGTDTASGGAGGGWIDTVQLMDASGGGNIGVFGSDWTVTITSGSIDTQDTESITLAQDTDGYVTLQDGSQFSFTDLERIEF